MASQPAKKAATRSTASSTRRKAAAAKQNEASSRAPDRAKRTARQAQSKTSARKPGPSGGGAPAPDVSPPKPVVKLAEAPEEYRGQTHRELALDSLERARRMVREGERNERMQVHLATAQVHALLAIEQRLAAGRPGAATESEEGLATGPQPVARKVKDYTFKFENEDEVPERIRQFVELTNDRSVGAAFDLESPSSTLLVAFGGMPGHMGMPPFEFFNISQDLRVKKAYLRDLNYAWYHGGIRGLADKPDGVAEKLREVIARSGSTKVVFAGNSAGGWAALLFGALVDVDLVLAFSPQTTLVREDLESVNDQRWDRWLRQARRHGLLLEDLLDLKPVLDANPPTKGGRRMIHYPSTLELDVFHAERLGGLPGVELEGHDERGGHALIAVLRQTGKLAEILADAVAERPAAA